MEKLILEHSVEGVLLTLWAIYLDPNKAPS
jgi:hypothetical protein